MSDSINTNSSSVVLDFSCRTSIITKRCNFTWHIDHFTFYSKNFEEYLKSPTFQVNNSCQLKWFLRLYPNGNNKESEGYISVYLYPTEASCCVSTKYQISILDKNNQKRNTISFGKVFTDNIGWGSQTYIKREKLLEPESGLLPNNTLTILCELQVADKSTGIKNASFSSKKNGITKAQEGLHQDIMELYISKRLTDMKIRVGDVEFKVHKAILAARSSVFAAMFEHNMEESKTSVVEIKDIEPEVMDEVLNYVYSGKLNKREMAVEILPVSDKYDLKKLKEICEESLGEQLTFKNAPSTLILADLHNSQLLKANTMRFINTHIKEVIKTSGWNELSSHLNLAMDIYKQILDELYL